MGRQHFWGETKGEGLSFEIGWDIWKRKNINTSKKQLQTSDIKTRPQCLFKKEKKKK
jgi:hypothetical protein